MRLIKKLETLFDSIRGGIPRCLEKGICSGPFRIVERESDKPWLWLTDLLQSRLKAGFYFVAGTIPVQLLLY